MRKIFTLFTLTLLTIHLNAQMNGDEWKKMATVLGENEDDYCGSAVSLSADGRVAAIGSSGKGSLRIFEFNGTYFELLGQEILGTSQGEFGFSTSINDDGTIVAVGAPYNNGSTSNEGLIQVYEYNGTNWIQKGSDIFGGPGDRGGKSVSLSGDGLTLAVGFPDNDFLSVNSGVVKVYKFNGTSWIQSGSDILGEVTSGEFGISVELSLDGNDLVIGDYGNDVDGFFTGSMWVFNYNGTDWVQKGSEIDGANGGDWFGYRVSISSDGNVVAGGAEKSFGDLSDPQSNRGEIRIFEYNGTSWIQKGRSIYGQSIHDGLGTTVSLSGDGNTIVSGGIAYDTRAGYARILRYDGTDWDTNYTYVEGIDFDSEWFGFSISMSRDGSAFLAGAPESSDANNNNDHKGIVDYFQDTTLFSTSINEYSENEFLLFPNPSFESISIIFKETPTELLSIKIFDISGRLIKNFNSKKNESRININLSKFSSGQYFIELKNSKIKEIKKFLKE